MAMTSGGGEQKLMKHCSKFSPVTNESNGSSRCLYITKQTGRATIVPAEPARLQAPLTALSTRDTSLRQSNVFCQHDTIQSQEHIGNDVI